MGGREFVKDLHHPPLRGTDGEAVQLGKRDPLGVTVNASVEYPSDKRCFHANHGNREPGHRVTDGQDLVSRGDLETRQFAADSKSGDSIRLFR